MCVDGCAMMWYLQAVRIYISRRSVESFAEFCVMLWKS